jgi:hypothetical protein
MNLQRVIGRSLCKINKHILQVPTKSISKHDTSRTHDKIVYHKNLFKYFFRDPYICLGNTLLVDDTLYECCQNLPFNVIFVESYEEQKSKLTC